MARSLAANGEQWALEWVEKIRELIVRFLIFASPLLRGKRPCHPSCETSRERLGITRWTS